MEISFQKQAVEWMGSRALKESEMTEGANEVIGEPSMKRRTLLKSNAIMAVLGAIGSQPIMASEQESVAALKAPSTIVTRDGASLFYRDWGTGKPVVFMSGWSLPSDMWNYQMVPLSEKGLRCISYDRRGHGRSSDPGRGYDYNTLADDLAAALETLDLRGVTLVSHSMGGGEVVRYITRHGTARIARVVLIAPVTLPYSTKTSDNPDGIDASAFEYFRSHLLLRDYPNWLAENSRAFVVKETSTEMVEWIKQMMLRTSMKAIVECQRTSSTTDFRAELPKINVPVLVIHGDKDASGAVERTGGKVAAMIPGAKLKIYEGAPHGLFVTHIDRLNADLLAFIGN
jgi:pimeloyl-ACP methyl ester carboxylesterase